MKRIISSVGKSGLNNSKDTSVVQELLNRATKPGSKLLKVDGISGFYTIKAIKSFQKEVLLFKKTDGLVEVGAKTWKALERYDSEPTNSQTANFLTYLGNLFQSYLISAPQKEKKIAWGAKVTKDFKSKVLLISQKLKISPDYLMSCMAFETGGTFSPKIKNAAGSGAIGLIQFMPNTAKALGTDSKFLSQMSAVKQLDYVEKYFTPRKGKLNSLEDVYMAILYPAAIGKPSSHALFKKGTTAYKQNSGLDKNKNGEITLKEISSKVRTMYEKGLKQGYLG